MNQPLDPSPLPWTYDRIENVIRAADGTEVCRFPSPKAYPIDIANARLILAAVNQTKPTPQGDIHEN